MNMESNNPNLRKPADFAQNMQAALGGLPVPRNGNWIMVGSAPPPATINQQAPAPAATHQVTMSDRPGRGRGEHGRGSIRGGFQGGGPNWRGGGGGAAAGAPTGNPWGW